jgi:hypothetical protein
MTPNAMPRTAQVRANPEYAGECMDAGCCPYYYVPRIVGRKARPVKRGPVGIRNEALADALRERGIA